MTVNTEHIKTRLIADGMLTDFAFDFAVQADTDVQVYLDDGVNPAAIQLGGYTNTLLTNGSPGGTISFDTAPAAGTIVLMVRIKDLQQNLDLDTEAALDNIQLENELDKITMITQQLNEGVSRASSFPITAPPGISAQLPIPVAGDLLQWNAGASALQNVDPANVLGGANLPSPLIALDLIRANAAGTALEFVDPATILNVITPPGTGNVTGPNAPASTVARTLALWNNTAGTDIKAGPAIGVAGQFLKSQGAGVDPVFADLPSGSVKPSSMGKYPVITQPSGNSLTLLMNNGRFVQGGTATNNVRGSSNGINPWGQIAWDPVNPPAANVTIVDWATTGESLYVVFSDGTAYAGGNNQNGQLGHGNLTNIQYMKRIAFFGNGGTIHVNKVFCNPGSNQPGYGAVFFVSSVNKVYGAGYNLNGQLGDGSTTSRTTPVQVHDASALTITDIKTQFGGVGVSMMLRSDGSVLMCGNNQNGQLGQGNTTNLTNWTAVSLPAAATFIDLIITGAAWNAMAITVTSSGSLFVWGSNVYRQGADGATLPGANKTSPGAAVLTAVASAGFMGSTSSITVYAVKNNGDLFMWGFSGNKCQFVDAVTAVVTPTKHFNQSVSKAFPWRSANGGSGGMLYVLDTLGVMRVSSNTPANSMFANVPDPDYAAGISARCVLPREIMDGTETIAELTIYTLGLQHKGYLITNGGGIYGNGYASDCQMTDWHVMNGGQPTSIFNHRMNRYLWD